MKPAPFAFTRPRTLAELLDALAHDEGVTKLMAGGQSLGPMLNLRLLQPDRVIDITGVAELRAAYVERSELVLGACVTHADIEDGRVTDVTGGAMARVASAIAYRAVRNRGTVGGSLAHADPAADWLSSLTCLGASVEIASPGGRRWVPLERFCTGALAVALEPGEFVAAIRVPPKADGARWGYAKHCRKAGEFAHAIAAVLLDPSAGTARIVIGAVDAAPIVIADARPLFGGQVGADAASRFDRAAADALLAESGLSDPVDRHLHVAVLAQAVAAAWVGPAPVLGADAAFATAA